MTETISDTLLQTLADAETARDLAEQAYEDAEDSYQEQEALECVRLAAEVPGLTQRALAAQVAIACGKPGALQDARVARRATKIVMRQTRRTYNQKYRAWRAFEASHYR